jgi:hypothetical protein
LKPKGRACGSIQLARQLLPGKAEQVFMPAAPITMKMRQALISIARIAVSPYPRYCESVALFSEQVTCLLAPQRMKTEPLRVSKRPLPNGRGSIFRTGDMNWLHHK